MVLLLGRRKLADEISSKSELKETLEIALLGSVHRLGIQASQPAKASDFMMREGVWQGGEQLAS